MKLRVLTYYFVTTYVDVFLLGDPEKPFEDEMSIGGEIIREAL